MVPRVEYKTKAETVGFGFSLAKSLIVTLHTSEEVEKTGQDYCGAWLEEHSDPKLN